MLKSEIEARLSDMEKVAELFEVEPFDIYFLGGCACTLGEYTDRATMDFDFVNLDYLAHYGRVFAMLRDFDMLDYETTILSPKYKERALKLDKFKCMNVYILSVEDIIVSKIIRLADKDLEDINTLIEKADKSLINIVIDEVLQRNDLSESKRNGFLAKLPRFRGEYNV